MAKVTIELTLDQLIEAVKKLSLEDQLKLVQSLLKEEPEEKTRDWNAGSGKEQLQSEIDRLIQHLDTRSRRQSSLTLDSWTFDEEDDSDLTVFADLHADDFQA